jgi:NADPH-dependent glutamate synthase beta subunit-like oxidoreductase/Pyruvate/2-oxoacid:ferredoxin oxidoreductase delta subunit
MSATSEIKPEKLNFRRYKEGDTKFKRWQQQIFQASYSYKCPTYVQSTPPCQGSCPSGEDIRGYLNIVRGIEKPPVGADGKPTMSWQEYAWRRLTEANPLPAVMGRVCPAPCETGCNRNQVEDHVGINSVEHYLGDWAIKNGLKFKAPEKRTGKKVAIIGGGPAGLSAAYHLTLKGHSCTIFDEHEFLGGMMRYGIPGYRTPRDTLDAEIQRILDLGVEVHLKTRIGTDVTMDQLRASYDAIFLGLGAQSGRALPLPGDPADHTAPNVVTATSFLKAFNDGRLKTVGKRVVVVGGGDTSMDVATVARRLGHIDKVNPTDFEGAIAGHMAQDVADISLRQGADVTLTSVFMTASKPEIEHAEAEGIAIMGGWMPVAVIKGADGRATALRVMQCEAKMIGGRLDIKKIEGTEKELPADLIVSAIGQAVDFTGIEEFDAGKGMVAADKNYQVAGKPGVFAGGDVIRPHLLTTAVGHGAIAADGIDQFLAGQEMVRRPKIDVHSFDLMRKYVEKGIQFGEVKGATHGTDKSKEVVHNYENRSERYVIPHDQLFLGHFQYTDRNKRHITHLNKDSALGNFEERLDALSEAEAIAEAKRCMSCGQCFECDNCVVYCPQTAVYKVKKNETLTGRYVATDYDKCIGCHICADVCPTGYIQMGLGE